MQKEIFPGIYIYFKHPLIWKRFVIYLHDEYDLPEADDIHPVIYIGPPKENETYLPSSELKINKKSIIDISTRKSKCSEMWKSSCLEKQWQKRWFEDQKCKVPFIFFGGHMTLNETLPICNRSQSLKALDSWKSFSDNEYCPKRSPCVQNKYTYIKTDYNGTDTDVAFTLFIAYIDRSVEIHKSFINYEFQNFIAEFGGFLGMFLGLSCFSIIECLADLYKKINVGK